MQKKFFALLNEQQIALLTSGQLTLTEEDETILTCAVQANITKPQWEEIWNKTGVEKIKDFLDLETEDYDRCELAPIVRRRIEFFQSALYDNYWSRFIPAEENSAHSQGPPPPPPPEPAPSAAPQPIPQAISDHQICMAHTPSKNRRHRLKYWLFGAVKHGCQRCVQTLVQEVGVDVTEVSDTEGYTVYDFAEYFQQSEMIDFLESL